MEKEERRIKVRKKKGEKERDRRREEGKEENETVSAKRRCVDFASAETFDIFNQAEDLESCEGFFLGGPF